MEYYSQFGQDKFLDEEIFKCRKNGFFIEIGAVDGIIHSNTLFFEKFRKWNGICVEPKKNMYERLVKNRKAICVQGCVGAVSEEVEFYDIDGYSQELSGIVKNYDPRHKQRITNELKQYGGNVDTVKLYCYTVNELLINNNITHADYCSIDTEGGELNIVKAIDLNKYSIDIFSIENEYDDKNFRKYMSEINYSFIKRLGVDDIYQRRKND